MIGLLALAEAIRLAPPLGRPLHYRTVIHDGAKTVTVDQEAVFAAAPGDGLVLTLTSVNHAAAAPAGQRAGLNAAMAPLARAPLRYRLDRGRPPAVIDPERNWATLLDGMRRAAGPRPGAQAGAAIAAFATMPPPARAAFLLGSLDDVVPVHIPPIAVGKITAAGAGTVARAPDAGGNARFHERSERQTSGGGTLIEDGDVAVSLATGLVTIRTRTVATASPGGEPRVLTTTETRLVHD